MSVKPYLQMDHTLNQFKDDVLNQQLLLREGYTKLYKKDDYHIDENTMAIFTIPECPEGKSIVFHAKDGAFFVDRSSKTIMNEYHHVNYFGFMPARTIARMHGINRHLPLVDGQNVFMPMSGTKGIAPDWISLHWVKEFKQRDNLVTFELLNGQFIQMKCTKRITKKVHDASFMSQYHQIVFDHLASDHNAEKLVKADSILRCYRECHCKLHQQLPQSCQEASLYLRQFFLDLTQEFVRDELDIEKDDSVKCKLRRFSEMKRWEAK